jgi:Fur family transcriptional regulator, ferric uptake regulator
VTTAELRAAIRSAGLRATHQRIAVLATLVADREPRSHNEIAERLVRNGERSTLYRNLTTLTRVGLLRRIELGDRVWRFEYAHRDDHARREPHFVCTRCGSAKRLANVELTADRLRSPRAVKRGEIEIQIRGLCDACSHG